MESINGEHHSFNDLVGEQGGSDIVDNDAGDERSGGNGVEFDYWIESGGILDAGGDKIGIKGAAKPG